MKRIVKRRPVVRMFSRYNELAHYAAKLVEGFEVDGNDLVGTEFMSEQAAIEMADNAVATLKATSDYFFTVEARLRFS